jgi:membrane protease YdiL (CAAX protease family)
MRRNLGGSRIQAASGARAADCCHWTGGFIAVSFSIAAAFGVVRFPGLAPDFGGAVLNLTITTFIFTIVFLGEEIGWRGYLLFGWPNSRPGDVWRF